MICTTSENGIFQKRFSSTQQTVITLHKLGKAKLRVYIFHIKLLQKKSETQRELGVSLCPERFFRFNSQTYLFKLSGTIKTMENKARTLNCTWISTKWYASFHIYIVTYTRGSKCNEHTDLSHVIKTSHISAKITENREIILKRLYELYTGCNCIYFIN